MCTKRIKLTEIPSPSRAELCSWLKNLHPHPEDALSHLRKPSFSSFSSVRWAASWNSMERTLGLSPAAERENLGWTQGKGGQGFSWHPRCFGCCCELLYSKHNPGSCNPISGPQQRQIQSDEARLSPTPLSSRVPLLMNHECFGLDVVINPSAANDRVHNGGV